MKKREDCDVLSALPQAVNVLVQVYTMQLL